MSPLYVRHSVLMVALYSFGLISFLKADFSNGFKRNGLLLAHSFSSLYEYYWIDLRAYRLFVFLIRAQQACG